jgi:hypothetical protein
MLLLARRAPALAVVLGLMLPVAGAQPQPSDRLAPNVRSEAIKGNINAGNRYYEVPPGQYWIVAMHSGKCMGVAQRANGSFHIAAETCRFDGPDKGPLMAVVKQRPKNGRLPSSPSAAFGFYPTFSLRPVSPGSELLQRCAKVAQGVVLGAPGIDVEACKDLSGTPFPDNGVADQCPFGAYPLQTFHLQRVTGRDGYLIRTRENNVWPALPHTHTSINCVDVREGSTADGAEHINFRCGGSGSALKFNQVFRFIPAGTLPGELERCASR